ncbi:hypothetical protein POX_c04379 [Penicillium oxalicum]|uniref:Uncharacterized protein n=1 Tax=Penicillium oxalicum (strain 114-2 / CGMCC 5302) TaxID=933388 RepID=S7Z771_PENO1|nr:hypothetical protein POX_c04379 [Penicillium oxalicum]EPS26004.1 hypothetical protein PDE_00940 [Penicillium oxalicum 114-2]KAI2791518.1 hypothetical protein POX_c04379 [Penicillium oxalicum]
MGGQRRKGLAMPGRAFKAPATEDLPSCGATPPARFVIPHVPPIFRLGLWIEAVHPR